VRGDFTGEHLHLTSAHGSYEGYFVEQSLVHLDIHQYSGTASVLRKDNGTLGRMDLIEDCGRVRAELSDRSNIG